MMLESYVDKEQSWAPAFKYHAHEFDGRSLNALLEGSGSLAACGGSHGAVGMPGSKHRRIGPATESERHTLAWGCERRFWHGDLGKQADAVGDSDELWRFECHSVRNRNQRQRIRLERRDDAGYVDGRAEHDI